MLNYANGSPQSCRSIFTQNVINLAVENCLICDLPSILTPTGVDGMTAEQLEVVAEEEKMQARRKLLSEEIATLENGSKKCKEYRRSKN